MQETEKHHGQTEVYICILEYFIITEREMQSCSCYNLGLKDMVLKLSGTQRQGVPKRGGSPPPRGRTTSLYRSGYYRPGVVQDDMAVPPATREKFAELNAKLWWEENKERIHAQYL
uniref:Uncharacterized protein n=1 Tax=Aegilops tauschii TaxID=37682 RepID=M8AXV0_AEGTA